MGESFLSEPEIQASDQITPRKNVSIVDSRFTKEPDCPESVPGNREDPIPIWNQGIPVRKHVQNLPVPKVQKNQSRQ